MPVQQRLPLMTIDEVAEQLNVSVRHIRRLVAENRIPYVKWGHLLRFDPMEIDQWLDGLRRPDSAAVPVGYAYARTVTRLDRITSDPQLCHGKPTIRGLRYPVETILELLAAGMSVEDVLEDYADLERDDILAAIEFGARAASMRRVVPLDAA